MSFIDLHTHVLPDTDDGAKTQAEALSMLRLAAAHGTRVLAVTPHGAGLTPERCREKTAILQEAAQREKIPVTLLPGMELMADTTLFTRLEEGKVQPLGGEKHILIEFDPLDTPEWCVKVIRRITSYGYVPLVAHPERYGTLQNEPWRAELWAERGAKLQVTRSGIFGVFGQKAAMTARVLLKRGAVSCVASDGHGVLCRRPILDDVNGWLAEHFGASYAAELLYRAPCGIIGQAEKSVKENVS